MVPQSQAGACERVRSQVALEVDDELSQLERAMVTAHVLRCPACRAYRSDVHAIARALRAAPLERPAPVTVRRYRRSVAAVRVQAGVAAAMAFAVVGIASQIVQSRPETAPLTRIVRFPSQSDLEREQALIELNTDPKSQSSGDATAR